MSQIIPALLVSHQNIRIANVAISWPKKRFMAARDNAAFKHLFLIESDLAEASSLLLYVALVSGRNGGGIIGRRDATLSRRARLTGQIGQVENYGSFFCRIVRRNAFHCLDHGKSGSTVRSALHRRIDGSKSNGKVISIHTEPHGEGPVFALNQLFLSLREREKFAH